MKISGDKPYVLEPYIKRAGEKEKASQGRGPDKQSSRLDRVEISRAARERETQEITQKVKGLLEKVPDVREDKVVGLKRAIEAGTYSVKGEDVARKMIKEGIDEFA
ncbi:MAG: flagellar biosynthesis anti-sigma factor FlgM [Deltaproteobacteria bacterium]|nr:flagellar biosynthesis anti-sigma factor FlgM [Deltaproteobacteria bacterium]MBW2123136.1 flagellar biosynthesis anti-sigma factor FlgM [Deltaproteobacteria bacterium]